MASWLDSFLSDGNWIGPALLAGAVVYSASESSRANREAAQVAAAGQQAQAAAIQQGNQLAQQRFETVQQQTAPALAYQQNLIANGTGLTPEQQAGLDENRRQTLNALSVSGLRGSGRATVAAVRQSDTNFINTAIGQNRARADAAASGLANQYFAANNQAAQADLNTGTRVGSTAADTGELAGNALIADASLRGKALGDIATVINDAAKEGRRSNYEDRTVGQDDKQKTLGG